MTVETEARELLAAEYDKAGKHEDADAIRGSDYTGSQDEHALAAITTALNRASEARAQALEMAKCAGFALDRISELDWSQGRDDFARDWHGHVEPALKRLDDLVEPLRALSLPDRVEG